MYHGDLCPVHIDEVVPGDTYSFRPSVMARLATPIVPYADRILIETQTFFAPARILWDNFRKMTGEKESPDDHVDYTIPQVVAPAVGGHEAGGLADYFGLPLEVDGLSTSAMFWRMYNQVFDQWYRDQNFVDPPLIYKGDAFRQASEYSLLKRAKKKDYFSAALPDAQRGDAVAYPLGGTAPVISTNSNIGFTGGGQTNNILRSGAFTDIQLTNDHTIANANLVFGSSTGLETDLSASTAGTVQDIRTAISLQHMLERDARGGTRYRETIFSHFGVDPGGMQEIPEYLGGSSMELGASEIPVTSSSQTGRMGAYARVVGTQKGFTRNFNEFGYIMTIASIRTDVSYQQNLERMHMRKTRVDHYWPDLALIGEQKVRRYEIYSDGSGDPDLETGDHSVWGYQPQYEDMRTRQNKVTGEFRSAFAQPLDVWHFALDFGDTPPVLGADFIEEDPAPIERTLILSAGAPHVIADWHFKVHHTRPMPKFGTPGLTRF